MWMCSGRSGNARALLHRQSAWQKGYFVLATQSARGMLPQLLCVCRLLWRGRQDVAATPGSNGAAKAPKKKGPHPDVVGRRLAWSGLSPKLPEKRWRGERASASSAGPFRPCPPIMGPSVSLAGPDAQSSRSRPPGLSQSTRSPSARHHQSRTCRVPCARAPPEPLPTRSSCSRATTSRRRPKPLHSSRIRLGAESFSGTGSRGPVARFLCGCARKAGAAWRVRKSTRAVWRTNKRYRRRRRRYSIRSCCAPYAPSCALPHGSAKGTWQASWGWLATWPSRVAGFRFRRTCLAERGGGGRCASLLAGGVSRHRTPVWILEYARHHPASGAS